jgi:hypothetical protein
VRGDAITATTVMIGPNISFARNAVKSLVKATLTTYGGKIRVNFSFTMRFDTGGSTRFDLLRDGTIVKTWHHTLPHGNFQSTSFDFVEKKAVAAGNHTYEVQLDTPNDSGVLEEPTVEMQETKR